MHTLGILEQYFSIYLPFFSLVAFYHINSFRHSSVFKWILVSIYCHFPPSSWRISFSIACSLHLLAMDFVIFIHRAILQFNIFFYMYLFLLDIEILNYQIVSLLLTNDVSLCFVCMVFENFELLILVPVHMSSFYGCLKKLTCFEQVVFLVFIPFEATWISWIFIVIEFRKFSIVNFSKIFCVSP